MKSHQTSTTGGLEERFDRERTRELFAEFARSRDPQIREELVVAHLNLVCTNPQIKKIFDITGLVKIFGIYDNEEKACENL